MTLAVFGLEICVPDLIWTIIDFFILFFLLRIFLFKPILNFMEKRQDNILTGFRLGRQADTALQEAEEEFRMELDRCGKEAVQIVSDARKQSLAERGGILQDAKLEAEEIRQQIDARILSEEEAIRSRTAGKIPEYVAILADRLLSFSDPGKGRQEILAEMEKTNR